MSEYKHFHRIKNPRQILQYGCGEGIGPMYCGTAKFPNVWEFEKRDRPQCSEH